MRRSGHKFLGDPGAAAGVHHHPHVLRLGLNNLLKEQGSELVHEDTMEVTGGNS